jgi:uncharacterized protein
MADSSVMREITTEAEPQTWAPDVFPSHAQLVKSVQPTDETLEELERYYGPGYAKGLYR